MSKVMGTVQSTSIEVGRVLDPENKSHVQQIIEEHKTIRDFKATSHGLLKILKTASTGFAVVAAKDIKAGEHICTYRGTDQWITEKNFANADRDIQNYAFEIEHKGSNSRMIFGHKMASEASLINCNYDGYDNIEFTFLIKESVLMAVAIRDISVGEEILVNYGKKYYGSEKFQHVFPIGSRSITDFWQTNSIHYDQKPVALSELEQKLLNTQATHVLLPKAYHENAKSWTNADINKINLLPVIELCKDTETDLELLKDQQFITLFMYACLKNNNEMIGVLKKGDNICFVTKNNTSAWSIITANDGKPSGINKHCREIAKHIKEIYVKNKWLQFYPQYIKNNLIHTPTENITAIVKLTKKRKAKHYTWEHKATKTKKPQQKKQKTVAIAESKLEVPIQPDLKQDKIMYPEIEVPVPAPVPVPEAFTLQPEISLTECIIPSLLPFWLLMPIFELQNYLPPILDPAPITQPPTVEVGSQVFKSIFPDADFDTYRIFCTLTKRQNKCSSFRGLASAPYGFDSWSYSTVIKAIREFNPLKASNKLVSYQKLLSGPYKEVSGNELECQDRLNNFINEGFKFLNKFSLDIQNFISNQTNLREEIKTDVDSFPALQSLRKIHACFKDATEDDFQTLNKNSSYNRLGPKTRTKADRLPRLELNSNFYKKWNEEKVIQMMQSITPIRVNSYYSNDWSITTRNSSKNQMTEVLKKYQAYFLNHGWRREDFNIKGVAHPFSRIHDRDSAMREAELLFTENSSEKNKHAYSLVSFWQSKPKDDTQKLGDGLTYNT